MTEDVKKEPTDKDISDALLRTRQRRKKAQEVNPQRDVTESVQKKVTAVATKVEKKEPEKKLSKEEKAVKEAKQKLEIAKKKLEEAKKKNDAKAIKKAEKEVKKAKEALARAQKKLREKTGMDAKALAKRSNANEEGMKKAGMDKDAAKKKSGKEDDKDKKKEGPDKDKSQSRSGQDSKAKMAGHINLPSGMRIRQDGPDYVLVTTDKAGNEHTTPVTDVMNQIDKYNKGVDAQNAAVKAQGSVQNGVANRAAGLDPAKEGLPTNGASGHVQVKGTPEPVLPAVSANELKGAEDIASASGKIKPEDVRAVSEAAMQLSKLDLVKDPKALEKLNERKKQNEERKRQKELAQAGRSGGMVM